MLTTREDHKKLKDLTIANSRLYKETAMKFKVSPKEVEECIGIVSKFIAATIKKGAFETVVVPHFGKFRAKVKNIQHMNHDRVRFRLPIVEPKPLKENEAIYY